jgi:hypothetical protein
MSRKHDVFIEESFQVLPVFYHGGKNARIPEDEND